MLRSPFSPAECQPHRPDRVHCRCDGIVFTAAARVRHAHARAGLAADPASGAAVVEHRRARAGKRCHAACPAVDRESRGVAHMRRLAGRRVRDRVTHRVAHAVGGRADGHRQFFQQLPLPAHGPARIARARRVDRLGRDDRTAPPWRPVQGSTRHFAVYPLLAFPAGGLARAAGGDVVAHPCGCRRHLRAAIWSLAITPTMPPTRCCPRGDGTARASRTSRRARRSSASSRVRPCRARPESDTSIPPA